jgi:DNA polymerase I-like protein with 3'-5' exonuclease and polymerase domains/intein/homing endonuclease
MKVWCSHCEKWSAIPADLSGIDLHAVCEHCGSTLNVESRYSVCLECGRYHRTGYEVCPFRVDGVEQVPISSTSALAMGGYSTEAQKRRSKKRGDEYYWQLFIDYRDKPVEPEAPLEPMGREDEPPHPADVEGYRESQPNLQRAERNGNGYGAPAGQNGAYTSKNGEGKGNGYGNGGTSGGGSRGYATHKVDLAVSESTPVMLFPEIEKEQAIRDESAQAPVNAQAGNYNDFDYELIDDPSRLAQVAEILSQEKIVGIDTETTGLDPYTCQLLLLQISTLDKVYIIDCKRLVPLALKPMLENPNVLKVAQNAKFEYEMLKQHVGITLAGLFDTMLAERLVTAGIGREISLKAIAQKYIGATLDKSVRESFYKIASNGDAYLAPEQLHYAARDAFIMIPIYKLQQIELKRHKLLQVAELEFRCIPAVGDMELAGVKIDVERWRKIIVDVAVQRDKAQEELTELLAPASMQATMFGVPSINLNSNVQLMEAFATLGVDLPDTMEATLVKFNHPAVAKLLEYRGHEKTLSAFGENVLSLINPKTGRIHPDFNQYGADTGRFSCLTGETLVSVVGGLKRLDAIQAGDIVLTSYGPKKVLNAWCNGVRPVLRVRLSDGRDLRLTADHQMLSGGGTTWVAAGELKPEDNLFVALDPLRPEQSHHPVRIDIDPGPYYTKRSATIPDSLSEPLCELAGLFTADGSLRRNLKYAKYAKAKRTQARYDQVRIALGWEDDELIALLKDYSLRLFNVPCREAKAYTCRVATISSTRVAEALARFGLAGTAHNKQVPQAILFGPPIFQAAYLRGLFEGDGHISNDNIGLTSVNRQLLQSVQIMLSRLGCYASIHTSHDDSGFAGSDRYRLSISGIDNMARFMQVVGFMSSKRGSKYIKREGRITGADTPVHVSGAILYREAVAAGLVEAGRGGVKPFVPLYKDHHQSSEGLKKLVERWGDLPELARAHDYITRGLHRVKVLSVEPGGEAPVYDLTIAEVSEFLANGLVVHNCTRPNVQQIPATSDFRKCFIAAEGYKLVTCVAVGTRIATTRGLLPIEEVIAGDQVLQEDGSARYVQRVINQGIRPTVKVKTALGYEIEATPEHRVRILDGDGCYVWREIRHLTENDSVAIKLDTPFCKDGRTTTLEYAEVEHFNAVNRKLPESITPDLARLFGYITGDGTLREDYAGWVVNDHDEDLAEYLTTVADNLFAIQGRTYRYRGVIEHRLYSKQLLKWLRNAGIAKDRVPAFLWSSNTNLTSAYLQGLFEADGSVQSTDTGRISFSTIHEQLAIEVQQLLAALGIASSRKIIEHGKGIGYIWFITIPSNWKEKFRREVGFLSQRKRASLDALVQLYKVNQHTGGMPNMQRKAQALIGVESRELNLLLANTRFRGSVVSEELARQIRDMSPIAYTDLELYRIVEHSVIFDKVKFIAPDDTNVVYDLTVEATSTYLSQGFVSHNCDYSQAELRILAELSQDVAFVEAFKSGQDLHTLTASQMFGVPVDQVQKPQRSAAKAINFGLAYGMGPGGLAPRLGVSLDEAKELISRYFKAYPGIQKWLDRAAKEAVRLGYSATPLGRKRFYNMPDESLKRHSEDEWRKQIAAIERQGKNTPIQGCLEGKTRIMVRGVGYAPISEVSGRDVEVWDGDRFVKASVAPSGKKQLVRMTLHGGYHIECSPDHKFWVACNNGYKWVWKWKRAGEIRAQNRVTLNRQAIEWSYPLGIEAAVPGVAHNASRACLTTMSDTAQLGEWLGRVASDGSLGKNNTLTLLIAEHEEALLEPLRAATEHWGHVHYSVRATAMQPQRLHKLTLGAKGLHDQLVAVGVKEQIPSSAWHDSSLLAAYLRGLFDGDGTVHPDGALLTFGQGDKHLEWAREVQQALLLLGIRSRLSLYTNRNWRINLRVLKRDMPLFCERVGFMNPSKQEKAKQVHAADRWEPVSPQYGMANIVQSIEFTDEWVEMYDVVNSESGRFMANGMIVHNSNADMTKLALINLRTALQGWDARTVNTVHDEIVVEVRVDQAEEVKHIVEEAMVGAGQAILKEVPIVADASLADYWSK